jgi:hypothetical protein
MKEVGIKVITAKNIRWHKAETRNIPKTLGVS